MHRSQMSLEDIGPVEALFGCAATAWTEAAHHCAFVVCQGMSVLVILPSEAFRVILAGWDGTFFRPFVLVREHVRLEILDMTTACRYRTQSLVRIFRRRGALTVPRVYRGD